MRMIDLLAIMNPGLKPEDVKLHLATPGRDKQEPIDVYRAGGFHEWQRWQTRKNFEREFAISLVSLPPRHEDKWLFAGVYQSQGSEPKWNAELGREYDYEREFILVDWIKLHVPLVNRNRHFLKRPGRMGLEGLEAWKVPFHATLEM